MSAFDPNRSFAAAQHWVNDFSGNRQSVDMKDLEVASALAIATQITPAKNEIKAPKMTASQLTPVVNSSIIWLSGLSGSRY